MSSERLAHWKSAHARLNDADPKAELGQWLIRSTDGGKTWSTRLPTIVNSPHGPIQLTDGRLLYAGKQLWTEDKNRRRRVARIDDGQSWRWLAEIPTRKGDAVPTGYHELHAAEAADDTIVVQIRNQNQANDRETLQSESKDGGKTWSVPHPIGVWGLPSHLLKLRDGRLLMSYGYRRSPYGNRARISADHGQTWNDHFRRWHRWRLGLSQRRELADGSLLTVWYESIKELKPAVFRQARWRFDS